MEIFRCSGESERMNDTTVSANEVVEEPLQPSNVENNTSTAAIDAMNAAEIGAIQPV